MDSPTPSYPRLITAIPPGKALDHFFGATTAQIFRHPARLTSAGAETAR